MWSALCATLLLQQRLDLLDHGLTIRKLLLARWTALQSRPHCLTLTAVNSQSDLEGASGPYTAVGLNFVVRERGGDVTKQLGRVPLVDLSALAVLNVHYSLLAAAGGRCRCIR